MNERWDCLEDLKQFLEWQKLCGSTEWLVEDALQWERKFTRQEVTAPERNTGYSEAEELRSPSFAKPKPEPVVKTVEPRRRETRELSNTWANVLKNRPPTLEPADLSKEGGIKKIKEHHKKHCSHKKPCLIGGGRPNNPVLILEGHVDGLTLEGRTVLKSIREKVLNLEQNQIYWLPYPMREGCGLCPNLFQSTLQCISPKIVLIMGQSLKDKLNILPSPTQGTGTAEFGTEIQLSTVQWSIPGIWTYHPTRLADANTNIKMECMNHLATFKRLLKSNGI